MKRGMITLIRTADLERLRIDERKALRARAQLRRLKRQARQDEAIRQMVRTPDRPLADDEEGRVFF